VITFAVCVIFLLQLEAAAAATREEKRRAEAALEAAEARYAAKGAIQKEEWGRWAGVTA
jgi:uncharacterized membrane protein